MNELIVVKPKSNLTKVLVAGIVMLVITLFSSLYVMNGRVESVHSELVYATQRLNDASLLNGQLKEQLSGSVLRATDLQIALNKSTLELENNRKELDSKLFAISKYEDSVRLYQKAVELQDVQIKDYQKYSISYQAKKAYTAVKGPVN